MLSLARVEGCLAVNKSAATIGPIKTFEIWKSGLSPKISVANSVHRVNFVDRASLVVYNYLAPLIMSYWTALIKLDVSRIFGSLRKHHCLMGVDDSVFSRDSLVPAWIKGVLVFWNLKVCKGLSHLVEAAKNCTSFQVALSHCCVLWVATFYGNLAGKRILFNRRRFFSFAHINAGGFDSIPIFFTVAQSQPLNWPRFVIRLWHYAYQGSGKCTSSWRCSALRTLYFFNCHFLCGVIKWFISKESIQLLIYTLPQSSLVKSWGRSACCTIIILKHHFGAVFMGSHLFPTEQLGVVLASKSHFYFR